MTEYALPIEAKTLQTLLPHRYPFLLLDRVTAFEANQTLTAIKNVTMNEPFFQGHFPGFPVMPGVLIMEGEGVPAQGAPFFYVKVYKIICKFTLKVFLSLYIVLPFS